MSGTPTESERKLSSYLMGWRCGARGGHLDRDSATPDFIEGHGDGREACRQAYRSACLEYGAELSPLRGEVPR